MNQFSDQTYVYNALISIRYLLPRPFFPCFAICDARSGSNSIDRNTQVWSAPRNGNPLDQRNFITLTIRFRLDHQYSISFADWFSRIDNVFDSFVRILYANPLLACLRIFMCFNTRANVAKVDESVQFEAIGCHECRTNGKWNIIWRFSMVRKLSSRDLRYHHWRACVSNNMVKMSVHSDLSLLHYTFSECCDTNLALKLFKSN